MRLVLFGLTGFGNAAFAALRAAGLAPDLVVTRREAGPYPYEPGLPQLDAVAGAAGVAVRYGEEGEAEARGAEVALACTYHRILPPDLVASFRHAFNVHPSLLPRYRGPAPCYWVLRNGEATTGITVHALSDKADRGEIVWQRALAIARDETQGTLRQRLSGIAATGATEVVAAINSGRQLERIKQDEAHATWFGRPPDDAAMVDPRWPVDVLDRAIRAATPFPGVAVAGIPVVGVLGREGACAEAAGTILSADARTVRISSGEAILVLRRAPSA